MVPLAERGLPDILPICMDDRSPQLCSVAYDEADRCVCLQGWVKKYKAVGVWK